MNELAASDPGQEVSIGDDQRSFLPGVICVAAVTAIALLVLRAGGSVWRPLADDWGQIAGWLMLILAIEMLPIFADDRDITWTLDVPLLLAVAVLYAPEVAATIAFVAAFDAREFRRPRVRPVRAIFNRAQVALSVYAAAVVFRAVGGRLDSIPIAALGVALALVVDYSVNLALASLGLAVRRGVSWWSVLDRFSIGPRRIFLATFFGYGVSAFVMAYLAHEVGVWAVAIPLLPTLVARHALVREQRLQRATVQLQHQQRLLEKAVDRAIDERRDERLRISGELHDEVLQSLTHVVMLGRLVNKESGLSSQTQQDAEDLVRSAERSFEALQDVIGGLRKSPLGSGGLFPTLRGLVRDMRLDWDTGFRCDLDCECPLSPESQVLLYQIAREALVNAAKHSGASEVALSITCDEDWITLWVGDNGVGFEPRLVDRETHFGIGLMEERVTRLGGSLSFAKGLQDAGTRLEARFPLEHLRAASPTRNHGAEG